MADYKDIFNKFKSLSEEVEKEDFGEGFATVGHVVTLDGKVFEVMTTPEEAQNLAATLVRHIRARKIVKGMMGEDREEKSIQENDSEEYFKNNHNSEREKYLVDGIRHTLQWWREADGGSDWTEEFDELLKRLGYEG